MSQRPDRLSTNQEPNQRRSQQVRTSQGWQMRSTGTSQDKGMRQVQSFQSQKRRQTQTSRSQSVQQTKASQRQKVQQPQQARQTQQVHTVQLERSQQSQRSHFQKGRGELPSSRRATTRSQSSSLNKGRTDRNQGFSREQKRFIMRFRTYGAGAFAFIMVCGFIVGLLAFARPTTSEVEKRTLTALPALTLESFLDGSYFSDLSLWYSDTYPLREMLVSADQTLKTLYGIQPETMMVGGNTVTEEIPDIVSDTAASETASARRENVDPPGEQAVQAAVQDQIMSGLYVKDGAAYSMYYFSQESVDMYADAISQAAEKLDGIASVYSVLIPTNAAVMLSEEELASLGGANQRQAIDYFYSKMGDKVHVLETLDPLRDHNNEYLYFRTDHHWTALGAYYIYEKLCEEMDIKPIPLDEREQIDFQPFLGSFYSELNVAAMAANPDVVQAYIPNGTNEMSYISHDGTAMEGNIITDVTGWAESSLYNCFIAGDQPFVEINNPDITDGSKCLIVKDSYGDCFVPFLVDNFQTVYVIDYRYTDKNIVDFTKDNGIEDVIILNNISIAGTLGVAETMQSIVQ